MTGPDSDPTPMEKALAAARESAQQCLQAAADAEFGAGVVTVMVCDALPVVLVSVTSGAAS